MSLKAKLVIDWWSIGRVKPYPRNARKISAKAVDKVAASIKEFGWKQPIVVDKDGVIVVGHARWKAAKKLRLKEIPVVVAADLTPAQIKAYRLMDNRSHQETEWDFDILSKELLDLKGLNEIDLSLTGFEQLQIDQFLGGITDPGWKGMPDFRNDDLTPRETILVHFRSADDRKEFSRILGQEITEKQTTMKMKGGNTDELYKGDGRRLMAESLMQQHPDCVTVTHKWGRWQHQVDYSRFRENRFIPKPGVEVPNEANNYGMILEQVE